MCTRVSAEPCCKIHKRATKYILHGGHAHTDNLDNLDFHEEILKDTSGTVKKLLVYFAVDDDKIELNKTKDMEWFERVKGDEQLAFEIADPTKFPQQVVAADIVYLAGGTTLKSLATLKTFANLKELLEGKIVAGESAGAYVLSTYFFSKTAGGVFRGLGLVPVKTVCHYIGENKEKLSDVGKDLELLLLPDYKFKVFEI